ncbi:MAG: GNAT family N-acetyltransferase [Clostridia bacterium]|nr:GNAT family N-acetyltransferase [Clostridia bacterium]
MEKLPQLFMRYEDLSKIPPLALPQGISLHNHSEITDEEWEKLVEAPFDGRHFDFTEAIVNAGGYAPQHVLYLKKDGKLIATTTAATHPDFPGEGWFRMVAVSPDAQGIGAGRLICIAALNSLAAQGFKTAVLSTNDDLIPALSLYYSLGFKPIYTHESHPARWEAVLPQLRIR